MADEVGPALCPAAGLLHPAMRTQAPASIPEMVLFTSAPRFTRPVPRRMRPPAQATISERKYNLGCTIFVILPYPLPGGADVQVVHRQDRADEGDIHREARLRHLHEGPARLAVVPVVRSGIGTFDPEETAQFPAEIPGRLHVTVRPVDLLLPVAEVLVRQDEAAAVVEQARDLREQLRMEFPGVLEKALRRDHVEHLAAEADRFLDDVHLDEIRRRRGNGDVDAVIAHPRRHDPRQGARPAADVEQIALTPAGDAPYLPRHLAHPEVRLR